MIRHLARDDEEQATRLWSEAFGEDPPPGPPVNPVDRPGRRIHVAELDGRLVGSVIDREYDSWFGGRQVPTAGIAGVTVAVEQRGAGLLRPLFDACLTEARERGALVSTMFPTAAGIYRRLGYEVVGSLDDLEVPTAELDVAGDAVPLRRATVDDVPAIRAVHARWAAQQHGPLTRTGPSFPATDAELVNEFSGITVTEPAPGHVSGYVSWKRGTGYGESARLRVADLIADDRHSLAALLRSLAGHASVAPFTVIRTSGLEPWRLLLRSNAGRVVHRDPYGLAVLDVAALAAVGYPTAIEAELPFRWRGAGHVLTVSGGSAHVAPATVPDDARTVTDAGLAMAFAGAQSSAGQRLLGHLTGSGADDATWDALVSRPFHVRDYF